MHGHTRDSDGRRRPSSPSPAIRAGIWRCAMPRAPRQLPSLPPPNRANPAAGANSGLDKTWGQGQRNLSSPFNEGMLGSVKSPVAKIRILHSYARPLWSRMVHAAVEAFQVAETMLVFGKMCLESSNLRWQYSKYSRISFCGAYSALQSL